MKIMIVDDDIHISEMLRENLSMEGYEVIAAYSGTEAKLLLEKERPDLILLDLMLPGMSGEELIAQISGIPVIVLSAKADIADKVGLLRSGAADYMTKPFDMQELLARIDVQLRKAETATDNKILHYHDLSLDQDTHTVSCNGCEIRLTRTEYAILRILMLKKEQVVAKLTILENISEDTPDCTEDSLKIHIHNLRRKLKAAADKEYISAVWGIGFMLTDRSEQLTES
ncbi:MAG: response regulator transcription factor [Lachnospiraceae bacterium]|nr:response regulator transcription factor [Lachnospiraceae bacterium]